MAQRVVKRRSDGQATYDRLVQEAVVEISRYGHDDFDVQRVMTRAKATNGSLYHHFGSKKGLIIAAETQQLIKFLHDENLTFRKYVEKCETKADFAKIIKLIVETVASGSRSVVREWRLRALVLRVDDKKLAKIIRQAQIEGTEYSAQTLEIARAKGWINPTTDTHAVSYWMQGQFLGYALLESGETEKYRADWIKASIAGLSAVLGI